MISEKIKQVIKSRAEKYAKEQGSHDKPEITAHDHASGQEEMFEDMIEFVAWIPGKYIFSMHHQERGGLWLPTILENPTTDDLLTTTELYELYLKQKG